MSSQSIDYEAVLADLKARRDQLNSAIAAIELISGSGAISSSVQVPGQSGAAKIEPDSFFGLTIVDAAKKYLGMMKRPQGTQGITDALKDGGYLFTSEQPVQTVASVLARSDSKGGDIVRVGKGMWGLPEWYPNRPRRKKTNGDSVDSENSETEPAETATDIGANDISDIL